MSEIKELYLGLFQEIFPSKWLKSLESPARLPATAVVISLTAAFFLVFTALFIPAYFLLNEEGF